MAALLLIAGAGLPAGCAAGRILVGAPSESGNAPANALVIRRCAGCHEAPQPATMSAESWQKALNRMRKRITLPEAEWDSLAAMTTADS